MSKQVIALDIDDTLFEHFRGLCDWYNKTFGATVTLADNNPTSLEPWGTKTVEEAVRRVHRYFDTKEFRQAKPFEDAVRAVGKLSHKYDLVVVTARDSLLEEFTHEWLQEHFRGLYKEVHFTAMYSLTGKARSKVDVCKEIGAAYLIDDMLETCTKAAQAGMKSVLFGDYPWSAADVLPKGVTRCKLWNDVEAYFGV